MVPIHPGHLPCTTTKRATENTALAKQKADAFAPSFTTLGHVDKRDSHWGFDVIQAGICYGDQLAPKPDERRRVVAV